MSAGGPGAASARPAVLQLTGMHSAKFGAMERYLAGLARACAQAGLATTLQYESLPRSPAYLEALRACGAAVAVVPTQTLPLGPARLLGLLRRERPRVVHQHFAEGWLALAAPRLARAAGASRCIRTLRLNFNPKGTALRRAAQRLEAQAIVRGYDRVLTVSRAARDGLVAAGVDAGRVLVHYQGLVGERAPSPQLGQESRRSLGIPAEAAVVACIGFDHPVKGLDVLLEAFALVRGAGAGAFLLVIGVEPGRSALPALAARLGVGEAVRWPGIRDDAWELLNAADLYVQPSRSEGLPNGVLEAMALGLPVVGSAVGGMGEAVGAGETGLLVPPGDPQALAAAVGGLLADPDRRSRFGAAGRARFEAEFRGEDSVRRLLERHYLV